MYGWRVRRVGKTTLARMLPDAVFMNCDLPSVAGRLEDPEFFFRSHPQDTVIVLDEVHRLPDPSRILKIAADTFPGLKILATGSSTLSATRKFRDALTGRKIVLVLPPVLWTECEEAFEKVDGTFVRNMLCNFLYGVTLVESELTWKPKRGGKSEQVFEHDSWSRREPSL